MFSFFLVCIYILVLYLQMVFYGDIILSRTYDALFAKSGRKSPILVLNSEYSSIEDPMLNSAKEVAIRDMRDNTEYIPEELISSE